MSSSDRSSQPEGTRLTDVGTVIDEVERDLAAGRVPRARQRLTEAARLLRQAGRHSDASRGFRVLAQLERRRGKSTAALAAARSALRVVRQDSDGKDAEAAHALLAELYCDAGDTAMAVKHASEWCRHSEKRGDRAGVAGALQFLSIVSLAARNYGGAVQYAETSVDAVDESQPRLLTRGRRLLAISLLQAGCAAAAVRELTGLLSPRESTAADVPTLTARAFAYLALGNLPAAARDVRKAARLTKGQEDRRPEAQTLAAQALAETMLARVSDRPKREALAAVQSERAVRLARRLRDPRTVAAVEWMGDALRKNPSPFAGKPVRATARELVELANQAECLALAEACLAEVQRLQQFPEDQVIPRCTFLPPVCFE